jgi:hypothetical protein
MLARAGDVRMQQTCSAFALNATTLQYTDVHSILIEIMGLSHPEHMAKSLLVKLSPR